MELTCKECGASFARPRPGGRPPTYCSDACRATGRRAVVRRYEQSPKGRQRKAETRESARRQRSGSCLNCGVVFLIELGSRGTPTYCSLGCRRAALLERKRRDEAQRRLRPEVREAAAARKRTEAYREVNRKGERRRLQDPAYRERKATLAKTSEARERRRIKSATPEAKAKRAAYETLRAQDPEIRARKLARRRERYRENLEWQARVLARNTARNALTRGAPDAERFSLDEIYERDSGVCHLCGESCAREQASMDHLIPVSKGGSHTRANVKLAHIGCNSRKNDRLLHELTWYQPDTET